MRTSLLGSGHQADSQIVHQQMTAGGRCSDHSTPRRLQAFSSKPAPRLPIWELDNPKKLTSEGVDRSLLLLPGPATAIVVAKPRRSACRIPWLLVRTLQRVPVVQLCGYRTRGMLSELRRSA
jgi:hypothetical protein